MRTLTTLFLAAVCTLGWAQSEKLDEGHGGIFINEDALNLSKYLEEIEKDELWGELYSEWMIQWTYTVNMKKFKEDEFFGLPIERIEMQCQEGWSEDDDDAEIHDIYEFTIYMKKPSEEEYNDFMDAVEDEYGYVRSYSIHEDWTESPNWWTSVTMLTVAGDGVVFEKDGTEYIWARFRQAYGG